MIIERRIDIRAYDEFEQALSKYYRVLLAEHRYYMVHANEIMCDHCKKPPKEHEASCTYKATIQWRIDLVEDNIKSIEALAEANSFRL